MNYLIIILIILTIILLNIKQSSFSSSEQKVYIVSFVHNCCEKAQKNLEKTALENGATQVFSLNLDTLEAPMDVKEYIQNNKRGAGFWIWKPYAIRQILSKVNAGDIIIYVDAGAFFIKSLQTNIDFINEHSVLCFKQYGLPQYKWTTSQAFMYYNYDDDWCDTLGKKEQFMATFVGIKNDEIGNDLLNKWLDVLQPDKGYLFDDSGIKDKNCKGFEDSRHDQQILSLINMGLCVMKL